MTFTQDAGQLTLGGVIGGSSESLTTGGPGKLVLGAVNTYTGGTTISAGTVEDGIANALSTGAALTVSGTGTFDLGGFAQTVAGLADGGVATGTITDSGAAATFTINNAAASSFSGTITNGSNALALSKTGAGTLTLSGTNTYSGSTTVSAGTLQVGNGGTVGSLGTGKITDNATLSFDLAATMTVQQISGTGSLIQSGTGTTILIGANSYGTTVINAGTLQVGNGGVSGTLVPARSRITPC